MRKESVAILRRKCDKRIQEIGRETYDKCFVCGGEYSCLHHFFTKGCSSALRYDWDNLIPICQGCHFAHHSKSDARIHVEIIKIKGMDWYNDLEWKKDNIIVKTNKGYYRNILEKLAVVS